ncbi:MAG: hypothetical protein F4X66_16295 [Chloroflexi bacterium]|nr:hypothetical protein [Chloroflexota bacterium]MYE39072.1 hypothetical protein [Chloroflexota bacterium]
MTVTGLSPDCWAAVRPPTCPGAGTAVAVGAGVAVGVGVAVAVGAGVAVGSGCCWEPPAATVMTWLQREDLPVSNLALTFRE